MASVERQSAEVLVVGGGLAGFSAALAAAESGAAVTLIEKTASCGGSTVLSGGGFAFAGTDMQEVAGIRDSIALLRDDLLKVGNNKNDADLVEVFLERQLDTYDWLKRRGVEFGAVALASGMSVPRAHPVNPSRMMEVLRAAISQTGRITIQTECAALRIHPGDSFEASPSVRVDSRGRVFDMPVTRGIVLATGGFSRSEMLLERYTPHLRRALRNGGAENTGDGFLMGLALGADHRDVGYIKGTFGFSLNGYLGQPPECGITSRLFVAMYEGAIIVNLDAKRFVNESVSYKVIGEACLQQRDAVGFQIFDARIMARSNPVPTTSDFRLAEKLGLMVRADTLPELAERLHIDSKELCRTIDRYNRSVADGIDTEFGRTSLGAEYGRPVTIEVPPFYGYPCSTSVLATYCGLAINPSMQLVNPYGEPVSRVFAAGEIVGGFHGEGYSSGSALSKAAIFGRIAGQNAAKQAAT